ncbi:MAG: prephenate dehydratase [Anaerolineae bacterium]|nr:prephenate dehydratase [Thermoflexales bacterium]MDW8407112.1 prephenate dehydratase [Anaerolineae bacterium]
MPTVAFQGEAGAYSEQAAFDFFGGQAQPQPRPTFDAVFAETASGTCDYGIVPVENSLAGSVHRNYDLLMRHSLHIVGEVIVRVRHNLIALPGVELREIQRVYSHWQALDQCEKTLGRLLPGVERVQVYDTAGAVKMVLEEQRRDTAAIASKRAAELYNLPILREGIEDDPTNFTRFVVLGREPASPPPAVPCKTSIVFATRNTPGALYKALAAFALRDIDLSKIESRPLQGSPWEYLFYLDFIGNQTDEVCAHALAQLREFSTFVRVLGSYPRANMPA